MVLPKKKTFFGKALQGIGKGLKMATNIGLSVAGLGQLPTATSPISAPQENTIPGGWLPEVTVTAQATNSKPISEKLMDLLDVASGNRPFQTSVGVADSGIGKIVMPAVLVGGAFMLYKFFVKR